MDHVLTRLDLYSLTNKRSQHIYVWGYKTAFFLKKSKTYFDLFFNCLSMYSRFYTCGLFEKLLILVVGCTTINQSEKLILFVSQKVAQSVFCQKLIHNLDFGEK
jgi:hypothetical protein